MLEGPYPNHTYPVKHAMKSCGLMRKFLAGDSKREEQKKNPEASVDETEKKGDDEYSEKNGCLMIFGETTAYASKCTKKITRWEVYAIELATPTFLQWSQPSITFDRSDHLENVPHPRRYLLIVDPLVGPKCLTKVLMDGGSGLNIMYVETLDAMGIEQSKLWPTPSGRSTCLPLSGQRPTSARRPSPLR
jgi:hypothetical protein